MESEERRRRLVRLLALLEGSLAAAAWFLGWLLDLPPLRRFRWDAADAAWGVAASLPLIPVFLACLLGRAGPLVRIRKVAEEVLRPLFAPCRLWELAALSLLAGIGEEMLFRGVLQEGLTDGFGLGPGLAAASLVFGLLHAITPTYAILATLMGAYLGGVWVLSGNLLVPIVAHAVYDFAALVYLVRSPGPPA